MPSFGTIQPRIEYVTRPGGYAVVINDERIAVVKTPRGCFLPGRGAEIDEPLADAAVRETKEETGLIVRITGEIGPADEFVDSAEYDEHFRKVCTFFSANIISRSDPCEPHHDLAWTTPEEAIDLLGHGSQKWQSSSR